MRSLTVKFVLLVGPGVTGGGIVAIAVGDADGDGEGESNGVAIGSGVVVAG